MIEQHILLDRVADLVDEGRVRSTMTEHFATINAANLKGAHMLVESGRCAARLCSKAGEGGW